MQPNILFNFFELEKLFIIWVIAMPIRIGVPIPMSSTRYMVKKSPMTWVATESRSFKVVVSRKQPKVTGLVIDVIRHRGRQGKAHTNQKHP